MKAYSGINSVTFLKGYDNGMFDKRGLTFMDNYHHIYFTCPKYKLNIGNYIILSDRYPGKKARKLAQKHGGVPLLFSTTLDEKMDSVKRHVKNGKKRSGFVLNPAICKVDEIYLVNKIIKPCFLIIEELSLEQILNKSF